MTTNVPVLIAGGGPVGMMLALHLDLLGVKSIIVDQETGPRWHPKGSTHNARTMEHFRRLGLSQRIRNLGLPADYPTDVGYFTRLMAYELARLPMPAEDEKRYAIKAAQITDQIVEPLLRCNQMYVERLVFEHLKTRPNIDTRYGWRCIDWKEYSDEIEVGIENVSTGDLQKVRCLYLAGCDGGQGVTRRKLNIKYQGGGGEPQAYLGSAMLSSHVRIPGLIDRIPHKKCWQYWIVNPEVRSNIVVLNGRDEFIFMSQLKDRDDTPDEQFLRDRLHKCIGECAEVEFLGHWAWIPGQALVADKFSEGRVFLAGDAVHLFTPTGGFGLNTGMDDAVNLAWKLAAVVQGWGGPRLLASYEAERRPIAFRNTSLAKMLTRNVGNVPVSPFLEEDSEAGVAARVETGQFLLGFSEEYASIGIQLGARYSDSDILIHDTEAEPADDPYTYTPSSIPGGRAPHFWFPDGTSLFDNLGPGFTLVKFVSDDRSATQLKSAAAARKIPLKIVSANNLAAHDLYGCDMALIRPDQYVAWSGNRIPEDCAGFLSTVTGY